MTKKIGIKKERDFHGRFIKGHKTSEKMRKKISKKLAGRFNGKLNSFYGKKHSSVTRKKITSGMKRAYANPNWIHPSLGRKLTKKQKLNLSIKNTGHPSVNKGKKGLFKHTKEAKKRIGLACLGNKHWNWRGGLSFEPYTINWKESLREAIRERDHHTCQICGKKQGDIAHDVHHVDYNKKNCDPNNLITLCKCCHMKTNTNRQKWQLYFKLKMEVLYGCD